MYIAIPLIETYFLKDNFLVINNLYHEMQKHFFQLVFPHSI